LRTTAAGQSALLLLDVIDVLDKRHIHYAIVGAFAASFYGLVRASLDADAVISIHTSKEAADLCQDLKAQGLSIEHRKGDPDDPIAGVINIQDCFHNRVDLLIGIHGMTQEVFHRVEQAQFMGSTIKIVSLEDFIAMKIFAGSPRDIQDVIGVMEVSGDKINADLLRGLSAQYGDDCTAKLQALFKEHPLKE
jgi:predicted nucleotidyltransferase